MCDQKMRVEFEDRLKTLRGCLASAEAEIDALKAKTETYCSYGDEGSEHTYYGDKAAIEAMTRLVSEVEGLKAECEGLRADAERYRTVRDFWPPQFEWIFEASFLDDQSSKYDSERASRMDGLVDAARTKETGHD